MKYLLFILCISFCSCHKKIINSDLSIKIQNGPELYDLKNNTFSVSNNLKADSIIKFKLLPEEKKSILQSFYDEELDQLPAVADLKDSCRIVPKVFFDIDINDNQKHKSIHIYYDCEKYIDQKNAQRVKNFLNLTLNILRKKPSIKNVPESDVIYL